MTFSKGKLGAVEAKRDRKPMETAGQPVISIIESLSEMMSGLSWGLRFSANTAMRCHADDALILTAVHTAISSQRDSIMEINVETC